MRFRFSQFLKVVMFAGLALVAMTSFMHTLHMAETGMPVGHCPYTQDKQPACTPNVGYSVPSVNELSPLALSFAGTAALLLIVFAVTTGNRDSLYIKLRRKKRIRWNEEILFSKGILNPKTH